MSAAAAMPGPQVAIAGRSSHTDALRPLFRQAAALFDDLDRLILHFDKTPAGRAMITAFQTARNIIERGNSGRAAETTADHEAPITTPSP